MVELTTIFRSSISYALLLFFTAGSGLHCFAATNGAGADAVYGPPNLFKTLKTPFGGGNSDSDSKSDGDVEAPIGITNEPRRSLSERLSMYRMYMPSRMILGKPAAFTIKGKPGAWAAIAISEQNKGAKPVYGRTLRLGPDRKLTALAKIPESGLLELDVDTPIQGDLVDSCLYFECAIWSKPDLSDLQWAAPVPSDAAANAQNGVKIQSENDTSKTGLRIVPTSGTPSTQETPTSVIDSGRP